MSDSPPQPELPQQQPPPELLQQPAMRLAEIISDLVSLRACDPTAALALVSARPASPYNRVTARPAVAKEGEQNVAEGAIEKKAEDGEEEDGESQETSAADVKRAKELVRLHYEVKVAQQEGVLARELEEARRSVEKALEEEG